MGHAILTPKVEPVFLQVETCGLTEHGKCWVENTQNLIVDYSDVVHDVMELAEFAFPNWDAVFAKLEQEGVPIATSGISQAQMQALINASTKNATYTAPAAFVMALATAAPTSTTTGATITEAAYTGYARTTTTMGAASAATPSVATNSSGVTFPACTGGTSTLLGFLMVDNATLASGAGVWFGTLTSVTISTTQTPPTVASGALSLSLNVT